MTNNAIISGNIGSIRFKSQGESTIGDGTLPDGDSMSPVETDGEIPEEDGTGTESIHTIGEVTSTR